MFFKKTKDPQKICRFCVNARLLDDTENVLCSKRGVVKESYVCKKYIYDYLKREPSKSAKTEPLEYVDINS